MLKWWKTLKIALKYKKKLLSKMTFHCNEKRIVDIWAYRVLCSFSNEYKRVEKRKKNRRKCNIFTGLREISIGDVNGKPPTNGKSLSTLVRDGKLIKKKKPLFVYIRSIAGTIVDDLEGRIRIIYYCMWCSIITGRKSRTVRRRPRNVPFQFLVGT